MPSNQEHFMSLDNLKHCESRFLSYTRDNMGQHFDGEEQAREVRKEIYTTMKATVNDLGSSISVMSIKDFNNEVLNRTLSNMKGAKQQHDTLLHNREASTFGIRKTFTNNVSPPNSSRLGNRDQPELNSHFYQQQQLRDSPGALPASLPALAETKVAAIDSDEFKRTFSNMEENRLASLIQYPVSNPEDAVTKYVIINGAYRDIVANPYRFNFTTRVASDVSDYSLNGTYKNIYSIEVTRIIMPMEIVKASGSILQPKGYYNMEFSFNFPYVGLVIDDFTGVCDGNNSAARSAFGIFTYDRFYKGANGRGHIVLVPASDEVMIFKSPLASLKNISMRIIKPNGSL
jgi:hypothetical protein